MTLVIASRFNNQVSFSSDSRMSFFGDGYFDKCVKIFKVPFRLRGPTKSPEDFNKPEFSYDYGIAVIGSSVNSYTFKESIAEIIGNLQYYHPLSDPSILALADFILHIYRDISNELKSIMRERGLAEILLAGYCIKKRKVRVLHFFPIISDDSIDFTYDEILEDEGFAFFGSGKKIGEKIFEIDRNQKPLQILKKAINSNEDKSIGGALQCGGFLDKNFDVYGVVDREYDTTGKLIREICYLRGLTLDPDSHKKYPYLFVDYAYNTVD